MTWDFAFGFSLASIQANSWRISCAAAPSGLNSPTPCPAASASWWSARLTIGGLSVYCYDSPVKHAFAFTPSFSLFVECETPEEVRALAARLGEGGGALMPAADYGFSRLFAWVNDRFGVSWQLNCA